ncbi:MAG: hypothetical protein EZS28_009191 [Streblomastix strix]|uniref:Uncharacterized protein n=1 Tax=Streblomastix strix TaxID=222440 RepID=A0A5J4WK21_9EUKA|nr:MAG: hypothetical protein EZS28_009191 [Streblomastix strix]
MQNVTLYALDNANQLNSNEFDIFNQNQNLNSGKRENGKGRDNINNYNMVGTNTFVNTGDALGAIPMTLNRQYAEQTPQ